MRARLSFAAGAAWAGATAAATLISWAGVQIVTTAVTPSPVAVLPASQIESDTRQGIPRPTPTGVATPAPVAAPPTTSGPPIAPPTGPASTTPPAEPTATTSAVPAASSPSAGGGTVTAAAVPRTATGGGPTTVPTTPTTPQPTTTSTVPTSTTAPTTTPTTTAPHQAQEFSTPGGNATFSCSGSSISLVSAYPADGYQLLVSNSGPKQAQVDFESQSQRYQDWITAACQDGQPQAQTSGGGTGGTYDQPVDGAPGHS